jgi:cyclic pyranopterin phosphate synthase
MSAELSHLDSEGRPRMVDVSDKAPTRRRAVAAGCLELGIAEAKALERGAGPKGDPWSVARIGAVQGAKKSSELIPLAHPLVLDAVGVEQHWDPERRLAWLRVEVRTEGRTGVEMEALAGVSAGLLVLYDMLKAAGQDMSLGPVRLLLKEGGRRGTVARDWDACPWQS